MRLGMASDVAVVSHSVLALEEDVAVSVDEDGAKGTVASRAGVSGDLECAPDHLLVKVIHIASRFATIQVCQREDADIPEHRSTIDSGLWPVQSGVECPDAAGGRGVQDDTGSVFRAQPTRRGNP